MQCILVAFLFLGVNLTFVPARNPSNTYPHLSCAVDERALNIANPNISQSLRNKLPHSYFVILLQRGQKCFGKGDANILVKIVKFVFSLI